MAWGGFSFLMGETVRAGLVDIGLVYWFSVVFRLGYQPLAGLRSPRQPRVPSSLAALPSAQPAGLVPRKEETKALIRMVECRICQEEDLTKNLKSPCACSGSLKYAHREFVQRWCNEKGNITCEICHEVKLNIAYLKRV
ncbi:hypothetical protein ACP4OV_012356 [Aristida adscensionis]